MLSKQSWIDRGASERIDATRRTGQGYDDEDTEKERCCVVKRLRRDALVSEGPQSGVRTPQLPQGLLF
jgi:hypothetical protein